MRSVLIALALLVGSAVASSAASKASGAITKKTAMALVQARAAGKLAVSLAFVCAPGQTEGVVTEVIRAGGYVRYRFDAADFLSVVLPTEKARVLLEHHSVEAAGIDLEDPEYRFRSLSAESVPHLPGSAQWPPALTAFPFEHPYDILPDLGADTFLSAHPEFDGRGVVIAQVENFPDVLTPELQTARDIAGRTVPKFLDIINNPEVKTSLSEHAERRDWQWIKLGAALRARNGVIRDQRTRYWVPNSSGLYRIGAINISSFVLAPIHLPGAKIDESQGAGWIALAREFRRKRSEAFAILWSDELQSAWLDTDRNQDFSDEKPLRLFNQSHQVGVLGVDDPKTARRESRGYTLEKVGDYLSLNIYSDLHATMVAGVATADGAVGTGISGVAPAAQIIAINRGNTFSSFGWAMIRAFSDERVDIVLLEASFPPLGEDHVKDGQSILGVLSSRLSRVYGKPSFWTASNEPSMSSIADPSIAPETVSVSVYDSPSSFLTHFGMKLPDNGSVLGVGSEGPAGNGALKPDLLVPSMMVAPRDGYMDHDVLNAVPGLYQLPHNYMVSSGTSAAAPIAVGAAALLVSAAKQSSLPRDAMSIKRALMASARPLSNAGAYQQGAGVLQVDAAFRRLKSFSRESAPLIIDVVAPVRTVNSHLLFTPHQGVGLFEREGWHVGDQGIRRVTLTRRSGPAGLMKFRTRLQGNEESAFSVAEDVELALQQPTMIEIRIAAKKEGVFSAILQLTHPSQSDAVVSMPMTVVVPYELNALNRFAQDLQVEVPIMGRAARYIRVPQGVDALSIEVALTSRYTSVVVHDPTGRQQGFYMSLNPISGKTVETIPLPAAGVWGLFLRDGTGMSEYFKGQAEFVGHLSDEIPAPVKVGMRVTAAAVSIHPDDTQPLEPNEVRSLTVENGLAALDHAQLVGTIGAVRMTQGELRAGGQETFEIDVRPGAGMIAAEVRPIGADSLDADLFLYNCTQEKCLLVRTSRTYRSEERVFVENPAVGRWKVVLDVGAVASGHIRYEYRDFYTLPDLGTLSIPDTPQDRPPQDRWKTLMKLWLTRPVGDKARVPAAVVYVRDSIRLSQLGVETLTEQFGCKTYPYCGTEKRETVPLGLRVLPISDVLSLPTATPTAPAVMGISSTH